MANNKKNYCWTKPYIIKNLIHPVFFKKMLKGRKLYYYIYKRSWIISVHNLKLKYGIQKGNRFSKIKISEWQIKTKYGIYSFTRKPFVFLKKVKKKKKR